MSLLQKRNLNIQGRNEIMKKILDIANKNLDNNCSNCKEFQLELKALLDEYAEIRDIELLVTKLKELNLK